MADTLSISPVALSSLTGVTPLTPTLAAGILRSASSAPATDSASIVDLSAEGRLLSALAIFQGNLQPVAEAGNTPAATLLAQAANDTDVTVAGTPATTDSSIGSLTAAAQILVDAFNTLLDGLSSAPAGQIPGDSLAGRLAATLADLLATPQSAGGETALTLADIGITASRNVAGGIVLELDPERLAAAFAATPASAGAVLANAARTFGTLASSAELQLTGSTTLPGSDLGLLGTAPPLAGTGLFPDTPPATVPEPLAAIIAEAILQPDEPRVDLTLPSPEASIAAPAADLADTAAAVTTQTTVAVPATAADTTPATTLIAADIALAAPAAADAQAATQRSLAASQALQTQLGDPQLRAVDNQADPAYAAVIAATHLSDFDTPWPANNPAALLEDSVGPVSALLRDQAIADYREAANDGGQRTRIGTTGTHQSWA